MNVPFQINKKNNEHEEKRSLSHEEKKVVCTA